MEDELRMTKTSIFMFGFCIGAAVGVASYIIAIKFI